MRPQHPESHRVDELLSTFPLVSAGRPADPDASFTGVTIASTEVVPANF